MNKTLQVTFKKGSTTYFTSSLFFPKNIREDVFRLYGFVRVADDLVDSIPPDRKGFAAFVKRYQQGKNLKTGDVIIDSFMALSREKEFDPAWTGAFLHSMALDLEKSEYNSMDELLEYIYGSAEVIGLYMAKILELPAEAYPYAKMQGRAMQLINFIRDIREDLELGRNYLPLAGSGLRSLQEEDTRSQPEEFGRFIHTMMKHYDIWQGEAEKGYAYIPRRYLVPIKTAAEMYKWTADVIRKDPFLVYTGKIKPAKPKIFYTIAKNFFIVTKKEKI